jgi:hypothetical protein
MTQKALGGAAKSGHVQRKNVPAKRKKNFLRNDLKGSKELNKTLENRAAAKALRNESKFSFGLKELNDRGKQRLSVEESEKSKRKAKKRSSADRSHALEKVLEGSSKRSKNDLE